MAKIKPFSGIDDRVCLADAIPLSTPFTLSLFPSNACNFKCVYCIHSLGSDYLKERYHLKSELMTVKTIEKVITQSQQFDRPYKLVSFTGQGEPLCNQELAHMIRLVKEAGIAERIDIVTNASFLTHDLSEKLVDSGLDVLRVSLQGISSEAYYNTCGVQLNFSKLLSELNYFYQISGTCKLYVKTVDIALSDGESEQFYELFSEHSDRMYIDKIKAAYAGVSYSSDAKDLTVDRYGRSHKERMVCPSPFFVLNVWPDGEVTPCYALYKPCVLGNIYSTSLKEMWTSEKLRAFQRLQLEHERINIRECALCCAPNDTAQPEDILDGKEQEIIKRLPSILSNIDN